MRTSKLANLRPWGLLRRATCAALIGMVLVFRYTISPLLGPSCRFTPSCSSFALAALRCHGPWLGSLLTVKRLLRCHPLSKRSGYDPIPGKQS